MLKRILFIFHCIIISSISSEPIHVFKYNENKNFHVKSTSILQNQIKLPSSFTICSSDFQMQMNWNSKSTFILFADENMTKQLLYINKGCGCKRIGESIMQ